MNTLSNRARALGAGAALLLAISGSALADSARLQTLDPPAQIVVAYSDLNLDSPAGAKTLYRRIAYAARQVCGSPAAAWYPGQRQKWQTCYRTAVENAIRKVNRPVLTALHEQQVRVAHR
jgi:UrcA family protein